MFRSFSIEVLLFIFYSRLCSFLGGSIAFNILAVFGWTYFVFAMALHRAPQVPPRVGCFRGHWHGADVKRRNSDRIAFLAVLRGFIMLTSLVVLF